MTVVSNTSPIINLAAIGYLNVLHDLFGTIVIPQAVHHEIVVQGQGRPGAAEVAQSAWIRTQAVQNRTLVQALAGELHEGEAEALALVIEHKPSLLLVDERRARAAALRLEVPHTGILGLLAQAKQEGHIPVVRPVLDALRQQAGFWISPALYAHIVSRVGE